MTLKLEISRTEDIVVVRCDGRIIFGEEADELRRTILDSLNQTKRIVLNLALVSRIDSCGLGTLVASFISARNRGAAILYIWKVVGPENKKQVAENVRSGVHVRRPLVHLNE